MQPAWGDRTGDWQSGGEGPAGPEQGPPLLGPTGAGAEHGAAQSPGDSQEHLPASTVSHPQLVQTAPGLESPGAGPPVLWTGPANSPPGYSSPFPTQRGKQAWWDQWSDCPRSHSPEMSVIRTIWVEEYCRAVRWPVQGCHERRRSDQKLGPRYLSWPRKQTLGAQESPLEWEDLFEGSATGLGEGAGSPFLPSLRMAGGVA